MKKFEKSDWVFPNYEKIINTTARRGISIYTLSKEIGMSNTYLNSMKTKNSKIRYGTLQLIARRLGVHGATKLLAPEGSAPLCDGITYKGARAVAEISPAFDPTDDFEKNKAILDEMLANMPPDERCAYALESIAGSLVEIKAMLKVK